MKKTIVMLLIMAAMVMPAMAYQDGTAIQVKGQANIYMVSGETAYLIPTLPMYQALGSPRIVKVMPYVLVNMPRSIAGYSRTGEPVYRDASVLLTKAQMKAYCKCNWQ